MKLTPPNKDKADILNFRMSSKPSQTYLKLSWALVAQHKAKNFTNGTIETFTLLTELRSETDLYRNWEFKTNYQRSHTTKRKPSREKQINSIKQPLTWCLKVVAELQRGQKHQAISHSRNKYHRISIYREELRRKALQFNDNKHQKATAVTVLR